MFSESVLLVTLGAGIGVVLAAVSTRVLENLLFGLSPTDPATFVGLVLLLLGVGCVAAYLPARRAARLDPMMALRQE